MQKFKIAEERCKEINKKLIVTRVIIMVVMMAVAIVIAGSDKSADATFWIIFIAVIVVMNVIGFYRDSKKQKAAVESYTLIVTDNLIVREQSNTPGIYLYFNDIKEIVSQRNSGLIIRGKDAADIIHIPPQIENYYALEDILNKIHPVTTTSHAPALQKYRSLLSIVSLAGMLCVYTVSNKAIVAIGGVLSIALLLWSLYQIQKNKNVDRKTKQGAWWLLVVLASVTYVMIAKLLN